MEVEPPAITPEFRGRTTYLTVECPQCGETARTHIPSHEHNPIGTMRCEEHRGGCGAEYALTPLPVEDGEVQMGLEAQLMFQSVDADEIVAELEDGESEDGDEGWDYDRFETLSDRITGRFEDGEDR